MLKGSRGGQGGFADHPPLLKGRRGGFANHPTLLKGGRGDFIVLPLNRNLNAFARELRRNMTDAERTLWSKSRRKQLMELIFFQAKKHWKLHRRFLLPGC
jgi:hypothetical protein